MLEFRMNDISLILIGLIIILLLSLIGKFFINNNTSNENFVCKAKGVWEGNKGMDNYCELNCNHIPPYCPSDKCQCNGTTPETTTEPITGPTPVPTPGPTPVPTPGPTPVPTPGPNNETGWKTTCTIDPNIGPAGMGTHIGGYDTPQSSGVATGQCVGNGHISLDTVTNWMNKKTVNLDGENLPVAVGHVIYPIPNYEGQTGRGQCGECYVIKSTKTGKKMVIMGVDGVGGVASISDGGSNGVALCSPEMSADKCEELFGEQCSPNRQPFTYKILDKCPT